jgi:[ribosomal protein S5]-alanine N-acetyltransferase
MVWPKSGFPDYQPDFEGGKGVAFAITRKIDGSVIGAISLMGMVKGHQAELGYWIGQPYWSQGFCTEAGAAILSYAFSELGLVRVHAHHFARNPASGRVMGKLGMQHEGVLRQHVRKWDNYEDSVLCGILKVEWLEAANKSVQQTADRSAASGG